MEVVQDPTIALNSADGGTTYSTNFEISDTQIKCDVCTVDQALSEQIGKHLMSGKSLPLHFSSYNTIMNVISPSHTDGAFSIQIARAFTRIKSVFATFRNQVNATTNGMSEVNDFACPHSYADHEQFDRDTMEFQLQVGTEVMPTYPIRSIAEFFDHLETCMNTYASIDGMSMSEHEYYSNKFIIGIDTEKASIGAGGEAAFTEMSTRGGETLRVEMKHINSPTANEAPNKIYFTIHHDVLVNIRLGGCEVLD